MEWDVYLLAGVGSTRSMFYECKRELEQRFRDEGRKPVIRELFPYGDHTRSLFRQVLQVGADLFRLRSPRRSGGYDVAQDVRHHSQGRPVLFIGHSGGCVAAYQAAIMLIRDGIIPDFRIVQVGSPKVPIRAAYRNKVSYFLGVNDNGVPIDPITQLGSWGGWRRKRGLGWYWDKRKYAPSYVSVIQVLGGHEHYFRNDAPYVHPVRGSNLSVTIDSIWERVAEEAEQLI